MVTMAHHMLAGMLLNNCGWASCSSMYMTVAASSSSTSITVERRQQRTAFVADHRRHQGEGRGHSARS